MCCIYLPKIIAGFIFILLTLHAGGQSAPGFQWAKTATGAYFETASAMAVDSQSNVYVTGAIGQSVQFGTQAMPGGTVVPNPPYLDLAKSVVFLAKYSPSGNLEWVLQDTGSSSSAGRGLAVDSNNNVYLTGEFTGNATFGSLSLTNATPKPDIFLAKFSPAGNPEWLHQAGGIHSDAAYGIAIDSGNNAYLTGSTSGVVNFGGITADTGVNVYGVARSSAYVAKYSSAGLAQWLRILGGTGQATGYAISERNGKIWVGGGYSGSVVLGGTTITNTNAYQQNGFVASYTATGDVETITTLPGADGIWVNTMTFDAQNNLYVSGSFGGSVTLGTSTFSSSGGTYQRFIARMNLAGQFQWGKALGSSVNYNDGTIVGDADGFIMVTGFTGGFNRDAVSLNSAGSGDLMVVKFTAAGSAVWGVSGGGSMDDGGAVGALAPDGGLYAAGWFRKQAVLGSVGISGSTVQFQTDIFVTRLGVVVEKLPTLTIAYVGDGLVQVQWPLAPGYTLQETVNLSPASWQTSVRNITSFSGINSVYVPVSSSTRRFFRLAR